MKVIQNFEAWLKGEFREFYVGDEIGLEEAAEIGAVEKGLVEAPESKQAKSKPAKPNA